MKQDQDIKKLKNLILYILQKYNNQKLTETKLQKLLYFCDFGYFKETNKSITGSQYRKNIFGPTIITLPKILKRMKKEGSISILKGSNYFGSPQKTFSIANPDITPESNFSESELLIIDRINEAYKELTPREISNISHADFPYLATKRMGETIKYRLVHYREEPGENLDLEDKETINYFTSSSFSNLMGKLNKKLQKSPNEN